MLIDVLIFAIEENKTNYKTGLLPMQSYYIHCKISEKLQCSITIYNFLVPIFSRRT